MTEPYDPYDDDGSDEQPEDFVAMPIFRHFKPETLKALTAREWSPGEQVEFAIGGELVVQACPLAWCLYYEEKFTVGDGNGMPGADQVAAALTIGNQDLADGFLNAIEREAYDFYSHWDDAEIEDLSLAVHGPRAELT